MADSKACEALIVRGDFKGQSATGKAAGYFRHRRANETPCRDCLDAVHEQVQSWRQSNPGKTVEYNRTWRLRKPEVQRAINLRAEANRDRARHWETTQAWRRRNPSAVRAIQRRWRDNNRDVYRENMRRNRARRREVPIVHFTVEALDQRMSMFGHCCWMCGGPFEHVDHVKPIVAGGPHMLANLRPSCAACNLTKGGSWPLTELISNPAA